MNTQRAWRAKQREGRENMAVRAMYWVLLALLIGTVLVILARPAHAAPVFFPDHEAVLSEYRFAAVTQVPDGISKIALLTAISVIDYGQSCEMFYERQGKVELNPVLGDQPTRRDMLAFGAAGIGLTWLAGEILPEAWSTVIVDSVLASEWMNIEENRLEQNGQKRHIYAIPVVISFRW